MKAPIPTEEIECIQLVAYLELLKAQGRIRLFTHIPNETFTRSWGTRRKNTRMGVRQGHPDYLILTNQKPLWIEMKRRKYGTVSVEQMLWINTLIGFGLKAKVCFGFDMAKQFIDENL